MSNNETIKPVELPAENEQEAIKTFDEWLQNEEYVLLVVFGEGAEADQTIEAANNLINSSDDVYKAGRAVWARNPRFILEILEGLGRASHLAEINWNNYGNIAMVAITGKSNLIAEVIETKDVDADIEGSVDAAYILALGLDDENS